MLVHTIFCPLTTGVYLIRAVRAKNGLRWLALAPKSGIQSKRAHKLLWLVEHLIDSGASLGIILEVIFALQTPAYRELQLQNLVY
jgi:hypothetical protein